MSPDEHNPLFPDATYSYPRPPPGEALPHPVPLGPITTPLPQASSVWHTHLACRESSEAFAVAARAPVGSVLSFVIASATSPFTVDTFGYALRGHNSLPTTLAHFLTGPLIFPSHIRNAVIPDWAVTPYQTTPLRMPLHIALPQGSPLIVLGLYNTGEDAESLAVYLTIDPPPEPQP